MAITQDQINEFDTLYTNLIAGRRMAKQYTGQLPEVESTLRGELNALNGAEETYNQEFLDRKSILPQPDFLQIRGVQTFQDILLFAFFLSYAILSIMYIFTSGGNRLLKTFYFAVLGAIFMGIIIQYF
jgi:hypothetical protein